MLRNSSVTSDSSEPSHTNDFRLIATPYVPSSCDHSDLYITTLLKSTGLRAHGLLTLGLRVNMIYAAFRGCCPESVLGAVIQFRV